LHHRVVLGKAITEALEMFQGGFGRADHATRVNG
jgi:hypothetical protein